MPADAVTTDRDHDRIGDEIRFGVLGPLEWSIGDTLLPLGTPKQRAVLAMMVLNANRPVGIDTLIDAAWDRQPPEGARATLHAYISNLRRLMRSSGIDAAVLVSAPPGYRLACAEDQCDLGRFRTELNAGVHAAAAAQFEQASRHLSAALAQWRGPVLDDLRAFEFVETFATPLGEQRVLAQTALAEAEIACGRAYSVITELETLTAEHSYREPLWAQLITAYYVSGRQTDALGAYHSLKAALADDLGVDPDPALCELYERILRQEPLDVRQAAQSRAEDTIMATENNAKRISGPVEAVLRDVEGHRYALVSLATRIGRNPDNDIVLSDPKVSRYHAVIADNGTAFVITDLGSANGVHVLGQRIHTTVEVCDGDHIRIGDLELTLETLRRSSP